MAKLNLIVANLQSFRTLNLEQYGYIFTKKEFELIKYVKQLDNNIVKYSLTDIAKKFKISKQAIEQRTRNILKKIKDKDLTENNIIITTQDTLSSKIESITKNIADLESEFKSACTFAESITEELMLKQIELYHAKREYITFIKRKGGIINDNKIY